MTPTFSTLLRFDKLGGYDASIMTQLGELTTLVV